MEKRMPVLGRTSLKVIALLAMLCDHVACVFFGEWDSFVAFGSEMDAQIYLVLRFIGRISFPIFCFVLVQGFLTTRSTAKYLLRLFFFAVLSEIPFNLAFSNSLTDCSSCNVMVTFFIGMLVLCGTRQLSSAAMRAERGRLAWVLVFLLLIAGCVAARLLNTDYSYFGVVLIFLFYILRENPANLYFWTGLLIFCQGGLERAALLALPFLALYRSEKQEKRLPRYFFYIFYPAHLFVLWGIYYFASSFN